MDGRAIDLTQAASGVVDRLCRILGTAARAQRRRAMAKGEAPRRRLITSDSEDEAPPAEPTFEDEPEVRTGR